MELRRELALSLGVLVLLNLLLAFGSIGLLVRMGPVIEGILEDNVLSIVAAEELLAVFAAAGDGPLTGEEREHVMGAFDTAKHNITVTGEKEVLAIVEDELPRAMEGDAEARGVVVRRVHDLISLNREAMREVDEEARRLTTAGAWAAVLLGFLSFLAGMVVVVRVRRRFLDPLEELFDVLESARRGDLLRRCRRSDAPREVTRVIESVNQLLDARLAQTTRPDPAKPGPPVTEGPGA